MVPFVFQKNKNKKKGKDEKCGSEVTTPENSSSPGMMDMHGEWEKVRPNSPLTLLSVHQQPQILHFSDVWTGS